jgi:NADPH:quinone reductase-like Zn-dependent oxidoreductase
MKAVVYDKRNAPEILVMRDVEKPACRENEVLVRIMAASINAADYRSMEIGAIPKRKIFGADIAGQVVECGDDCHRLQVGDEVFGDLSGCGFGGFAEFASVPENMMALKPAGVSSQDAAAVPIAAVTALQALRNKGNLQSGQKVLIYGAGGGVGHYAVQLVRYFGGEVTAVCGTRNVSIIQALGADTVIDYTKEDVLKNSKAYDLILAVNGNRALFSFRRVLARHGTYVMVGGGYAQVIQAMLFSGLMSVGSKKYKFLAAKPNPDDLETIIGLVAEGKIKPVIDRCYPLEETAQAMRYTRQGHACGKVIINVGQA